MQFYIGDLPVLFPYPRIYPEQWQYMSDLKKTLDAGGHCILEMPSGTGKTISLLSLIVSYQMFHKDNRKFIYCSRTMSEIEKALIELKLLMQYREKELGYKEDFRGVGLTSRKNLCLHSSVSKAKKGKIVDARCRSLTCRAAKEKKLAGMTVDLCEYHENLEDIQPFDLLPTGVYTISDLLELGRQKKQCPYFMSRRILTWSNVIIYSYHYLLDPKIATRVSSFFGRESIIVFDEAHNIDNVCIESLSIDLTNESLEKATKGLEILSKKIDDLRQQDAEKLNQEYQSLLKGLKNTAQDIEEDSVMVDPIIPSDVLQEVVPGSIRRAEHFVSFLRRFLEYLKVRMKVLHVISENPASFLQHLKELTFIEKKPLRFCSERLSSLMKTIGGDHFENFDALQDVAIFSSLISAYDHGFVLILEPYESKTATVPNPILHLSCLDASIAMKPIFERFMSVIVTSGTISPLDMLPKMLQFSTVIQKSYSITLARSCFLPLIITKGNDQVTISSKFEIRNDPSIIRNYGNILVEYAKVVPDGLVCFFPSYLYMESIVSQWQTMGILDEAWKYKLILVETPDSQETTFALESYRTACDNGRGAILFSVARGKVSEGVDFDHQYGRCVIMFGIPYQYTESRILRARLEFLRDNYGIRENEFLSFDAMRHAAQCLGRVIRGKEDYGVMVLADSRFARMDKRAKLPKWIQQYLLDSSCNLSTDISIAMTKKFLRSMSQPYKSEDQNGISWWDSKDIDEYQKQILASTVNDDKLEANKKENNLPNEFDEFDSDEFDLEVDITEDILLEYE